MAKYRVKLYVTMRGWAEVEVNACGPCEAAEKAENKVRKSMVKVDEIIAQTAYQEKVENK